MQTIYDPNVPGFFRSLFIVRSVLYDTKESTYAH